MINENNILILTEEECKEIMKLNIKKDSLNELIVALVRSDISTERSVDIYNRLCNDMECVKYSITQWWTKIKKKYSINLTVDYKWQLNYDSREIKIILL